MRRRTTRCTTQVAVPDPDVTPNPNYEQSDNRSVPFAGDDLWVTPLGDFAFGTWTD